MSTSPKDLAAAVSALVTSPDAAEMYDSLTVVVRLVTQAHQPVALTGNAAVLNALVDLAREDRTKLDRLMALVDVKRAEAGLAPLVTPPDEGFDKKVYMREFMAQKRLRERRAVTIENIARSERDALRGHPRMEFCRLQSLKWKTRLDELTSKVRDAHGGRAPKEALELAREKFWADIDSELDEAEAAARKKLQGRG